MGWWNDANREELRQLWAAGLSSRQIAAKLGCTHNSVVGQARRLNLPYRAGPKASREAQSALSRRAGAISAKRRREGEPGNATGAEAIYRKQYERIHKAMLLKDAHLKGHPLVELTERQCRWPVSEDGLLFCGHPKLTGMSYCDFHARRAFVPVPMQPERQRGKLEEELLVRAKVEAA